MSSDAVERVRRAVESAAETGIPVAIEVGVGEERVVIMVYRVRVA